MNGATSGNKLKRIVIILTLVAIAGAVLWGVRRCNSYQARKQAEEMRREQRDSTIRAVINRHSRLYTAEAKSRKTITYTSDNKKQNKRYLYRPKGTVGLYRYSRISSFR